MRYGGKNFVEPGRPQMTVWRMRFACWIPKATSTDSHLILTLFSTATMFALMHLNVTFMRTLPVLFLFLSMAGCDFQML